MCPAVRTQGDVKSRAGRLINKGTRQLPPLARGHLVNFQIRPLFFEPSSPSPFPICSFSHCTLQRTSALVSIGIVPSNIGISYAGSVSPAARELDASTTSLRYNTPRSYPAIAFGPKKKKNCLRQLLHHGSRRAQSPRGGRGPPG